jgi:hypothetical protein
MANGKPPRSIRHIRHSLFAATGKKVSHVALDGQINWFETKRSLRQLLPSKALIISSESAFSTIDNQHSLAVGD